MSQKLFQIKGNTVLVSDGLITYEDSKENFKKDCSNAPLLNNDFLLYNRSLCIYVIEGELKEFTEQQALDGVIDTLMVIQETKSKRTAVTEKAVGEL